MILHDHIRYAFSSDAFLWTHFHTAAAANTGIGNEISFRPLLRTAEGEGGAFNRFLRQIKPFTDTLVYGQQRLTSLYAVMKGKKVINSKYDEKAIVISYCPLKNKFEVGYQATKKDPEWIYNISEVFTTTNITKLIINFTKKLAEYRTSKGEALSDEEQDLISENITALSNLKQHTLPVFDIKANGAFP